MSRASDFLARFRPVGAPGAAATAGVPADRVAELSAELEPVFALLADTEAELDQIRRTATEHIRGGHSDAAERAAAILASARLRADSERAEAAARAHHDAERQAARDLAAADAEAARVRRLAAGRLDHAVAEVVTAVRAVLSARETA